MAATYKAYQRYEQLLDMYAGSELIDRALRRELAIAGEYLAGKKRRPAGDGDPTSQGRGVWTYWTTSAISRAPGTALAEQALKMRADYFYNRGEFFDAEQEYARLAREYPTGAYAAVALLRSAQSAMASFSGVKF